VQRAQKRLTIRIKTHSHIHTWVNVDKEKGRSTIELTEGYVTRRRVCTGIGEREREGKKERVCLCVYVCVCVCACVCVCVCEVGALSCFFVAVWVARILLQREAAGPLHTVQDLLWEEKGIRG
jgi:hypothetical protein